MADQVLVAPPGITRPDLFAERNIKRYTPPPMGPRSSLIVGGPAYFTPEGYEAPYQPEAAFMPTDTRPDPIGDQFRRMNPPPPPPEPTPEPPYIGPILPPTPMPPPTTQGWVEEPTPYVPTPTSTETVDPTSVEESVTPPPANGFFPDGVPGLADLDFSGLPQYQMPPPPPPPPSLAEPTPAPSYIPEELIDVSGDPLEANLLYGGTQRYIPMRKIVGPNPDYVPPANAPTTTPGSQFDPVGQYDYEGPFGDIDIPPSTTTGPFTGKPLDWNWRPPQYWGDQDTTPTKPTSRPGPPRPTPGMDKKDYYEMLLAQGFEPPGKIVDPPRGGRGPMPPIYTPPPPIEEMFEDYDYGNPNLRNRGMFGPRR